jgi:hypothetical protein
MLFPAALRHHGRCLASRRGRTRAVPRGRDPDEHRGRVRPPRGSGKTAAHPMLTTGSRLGIRLGSPTGLRSSAGRHGRLRRHCQCHPAGTYRILLAPELGADPAGILAPRRVPLPCTGRGRKEEGGHAESDRPSRVRGAARLHSGSPLMCRNKAVLRRPRFACPSQIIGAGSRESLRAGALRDLG